MYEAIKAEIKRWINLEYNTIVSQGDCGQSLVVNALEKLLSFIESLEKEQETVYVKAPCAICCYDKGCDTCEHYQKKKSEKPTIPQGLDEAAEESATKEGLLAGPVHNAAVRTFKAGAKLMAEQNLGIVKSNIERAQKCMEQSTGFEEYPYWDGAHDMANAIRREMELATR